MSKAGIVIRPPPPTTASKKPATKVNTQTSKRFAGSINANKFSKIIIDYLKTKNALD